MDEVTGYVIAHKDAVHGKHYATRAEFDSAVMTLGYNARFYNFYVEYGNGDLVRI